MMTAATRDAIAGDPLLAESPFAEVLAKDRLRADRAGQPLPTPDAVRTKLPTIRQTLDAEVFNAALAKRSMPRTTSPRRRRVLC
jgi:ParB family chromosome partitioning protein